MNKLEFVQRASERARTRYHQEFSAALLNDLMKADLVPKARRLSNNGRRPVYAFDAPAYRRALQITRIRAAGIVGHDALRIMLFLKGYSEPAWRVREAILAEYVANGRSLLAPVRSTYRSVFP